MSNLCFSPDFDILFFPSVLDAICSKVSVGYCSLKEAVYFNLSLSFKNIPFFLITFIAFSCKRDEFIDLVIFATSQLVALFLVLFTSFTTLISSNLSIHLFASNKLNIYDICSDSLKYTTYTLALALLTNLGVKSNNDNTSIKYSAHALFLKLASNL